MKQYSKQLAVVFLACVVAFFATTLPVAAQTISLKPTHNAISIPTPSDPTTPIQCAHLQVHLNGTPKPTTKCLDSTLTAGLIGPRLVGPNIVAVTCGSNSLILWADANFSGWTLCLEGYGSTDMTSYCGPAPAGCLWNWNDNASSYATGCAAGIFYVNIGDTGQSQSFSSTSTKANFDGQSGRLSNDTLSSVFLNSNC